MDGCRLAPGNRSVCGVPAMSIPKRQRKSGWQRRDGDEVDVIGHQAITKQGHLMIFDVLS